MENHNLDLKTSIIELLDNVILRINQIELEISNDINVNDRLVYLIDDLMVLSNGVATFGINIDKNEYHFVLNNVAENLEKNERYFLGEILTMELQPLLTDWKVMIEHE